VQLSFKGGSPSVLQQHYFQVCLAENWWRMAAFHGTLVQHDQDGNGSIQLIK
jgi:hypothetical protein